MKIIAALSLLLLCACSDSNSRADNNEQLVRDYIQAFANKQPKTMLMMVNDDIRWHYLELKGINYSGQGKKQLAEELAAYFAATDLKQVKVLKIQSEGDWVTVFEAPTWLKDQQEYSQKGVSVYYIDKAKISEVWYYPAFDKKSPSSE